VVIVARVKQKAATRRSVTADCRNAAVFVGARGALRIVDHLRRRFASFKLRAHLLDLRSVLTWKTALRNSRGGSAV